MESYLKEEYDVIEDKEYLQKESDIVAYFKDEGRDYLDCGQGYFQDEADVLCKIGDKFYSVSIEAEVIGEKQDRGYEIYFVDNISKVSYKEIDKPLPKTKKEVQYNLLLTDYQQKSLESFMKASHIEIQ